MSMENLVERKLAGEIEELGENLPQYQSVHNKSHMAWPAMEALPSRWDAGD
jgi:hypothetical protein